MKIKTPILTVFIAVAIAIGVTTVVLINQPANRSTTAETASTSPQVQSSVDESDILRFTAEEGKSVLDQLKTRATVETKESEFGPYVDSINGRKGGTDYKYWSFYVNGDLAQVGAADYITKAGDVVEWKFE